MTDWWDSIDGVARFNNWMQVSIVVFGVLTAVATALTITASNRIASLQTAREEGLRDQIERAEDRSAQAEEQAGKAAQAAAKADYRDLSPRLRQQLLDRMEVMTESETWKDFKVLITVESSSPPGTRRFAEELASVMSQAGFDVTRPSANNVHMEGASLPLWVCNEQQQPLAEEMATALRMILHTAGTQRLEAGGEINTLRIHFAGQPSFDEQGCITLQ